MAGRQKAELGCIPLVERIRRRIEESPDGCVRFRDFMEWCLYEPEYGYYMNQRTKVGKEGDFYTSAYVGSVMGDLLSRYLSEICREYGGSLQVAEWGAGTGRLAAQILETWKTKEPDVYEKVDYTIVEKSPFHRALLKEELSAHLEHVRFIAPDEPYRYRDDVPVVVLSNELLDAFPVHRVRMRDSGLQELGVIWNEEEGSFQETEYPCTDPELYRYLRDGGIALSVRQTAEINLMAEAWMKEQAERLTEGRLITIDYGDEARELYAPHRMAGTLLCYKDHQAYDQPYIHIGEQDLTSHVDFSACIRAGSEAGITEWKLYTQKQFLLENGVLELLQSHSSIDPFGPEARRNRSIRQLLLTDHMSELFKVLVQTRRR